MANQELSIELKWMLMEQLIMVDHKKIKNYEWGKKSIIKACTIKI